MHREISTQLYDYYMDFSPKAIRRAFTLLFQLNKLFRLLLIHFMFYHSIWWSPNSVSSNLAINYSLIDLKLFAILAYLNFYEFIVNTLVFNLIVVTVLKQSNVPNSSILRTLLTYIELGLYLFCDLLIFGYLKFQLTFPNETIALFLGPHLFFLINSHFDLNFTFLNICFFSNLSFANQSREARAQSTAVNYSQSSAAGIHESNGASSDLSYLMETKSVNSSSNKNR
jgi:hypothetical protein